MADGRYCVPTGGSGGPLCSDDEPPSFLFDSTCWELSHIFDALFEFLRPQRILISRAFPPSCGLATSFFTSSFFSNFLSFTTFTIAPSHTLAQLASTPCKFPIWHSPVLNHGLQTSTKHVRKHVFPHQPPAPCGHGQLPDGSDVCNNHSFSMYCHLHC
jgi:hypothetical protein